MNSKNAGSFQREVRNDNAGKCGANLATTDKSIVASFKGAPAMQSIVVIFLQGLNSYRKLKTQRNKKIF